MGGLISGKAIRHSLLAIRHSPFTIRYSPFAIRCRFRLGRSLALPFSRVPCPMSHHCQRSRLGTCGFGFFRLSQLAQFFNQAVNTDRHRHRQMSFRWDEDDGAFAFKGHFVEHVHGAKL